MSQSKILRHVFENVDKIEDGDSIEGPIEYHFKIPWKMRLHKSTPNLEIYLDCPVSSDSSDWSIDVHLNRRMERKRPMKPSLADFYKTFSAGESSHKIASFLLSSAFVADGNVTIEMTIQIDKLSEHFERKKLRNFGESSDKHSDVVLIVGEEKFHCNKMYLATHCTYFDTLFFGNFAESKKSAIELKDIDPEDFQDFLELIYGESLLHDCRILEILHLANFFDSKSAIRRCDVFLQEKSKLPLKDKFQAAIKYNLDALKEKCLSEMKTSGDFKSIVPEDSDEFDTKVWKELFLTYSSIYK